MKKAILTTILGLVAYCSYAQNIFPPSGNVGIGTTTPISTLHVAGNGSSVDGGSVLDPNAMVIQANTGGRSTAIGAQLEFVIPANTDGTNLWGQARIITIAGSPNSSDATGKMILGTRRLFNKQGTGAQWYYGNDIVINGNGNVGIGTTIPGAALTVTNPTPLIQLFDSDFNPVDGSSLGKLAFGSMAEFASIEGIRTSGQLDDVTQIRFSTSFATGAGGDGDNIERMRLTQQGNLLINKTSQTNPSYKLDVNGNVRANQITVSTNGADFVFASKYKLTPLVALKKYIDQNHHLPEIASAQQMQTEGLNLGENQTKLLQKLEELTLYIIDQDKLAKKQQEKIVSQEERITKLEKALEQVLKGKKTKN